MYYVEKLSEKFTQDEAEFLLFWLFEDFFDYSRENYLLDEEFLLNESELLKLHFAVKDLLANKPIQYLVGNVEFCGLKLKLNENVLIPRPETEELIELIHKRFKDEPIRRILDVGSGSGCIALSLKKYFPEADILSVDISAEALEVARINAKLNMLEVQFLNMDFLDSQKWGKIGPIDLLVSNPPYVTHEDRSKMNLNVTSFEPPEALFVTQEDPLIFYRAIRDFAKDFLETNGYIFCEINEQYGEELVLLFEEFKQFKPIVYKDFRDKPRFLSVRRT